MRKPVIGWPGVSVSRAGEVFVGGKSTPQNINGAGYYYVNLYRRNRRHSVAVHVLMCRAFHGRRPTSRHVVGHRDGQKTNNQPHNVRWVTHRENELDKARHGRDIRGERHPNVVLTRATVRWARKAYASEKYTIAFLAKIMGVRAPTLYSAVTGQSWAWLK